MTSPVFISYRRADAQHVAARLFSSLTPKYLAPAEVFMDVEAIAAGADFVARLKQQLATCKVALVLIGPKWLEADASGKRRIDDPRDFVRLEVAEVLSRNITVIPVLVDGARMPHSDELPDPLKPLAVHNAVTLRHESFRQDADTLGVKVLGVLDRSIDPELDLDLPRFSGEPFAPAVSCS